MIRTEYAEYVRECYAYTCSVLEFMNSIRRSFALRRGAALCTEGCFRALWPLLCCSAPFKYRIIVVTAAVYQRQQHGENSGSSRKTILDIMLHGQMIRNDLHVRTTAILVVAT